MTSRSKKATPKKNFVKFVVVDGSFVVDWGDFDRFDFESDANIVHYQVELPKTKKVKPLEPLFITLK